MRIPYGEHKGCELSDLDEGSLRWLLDTSRTLVTEITRELDRRRPRLFPDAEFAADSSRAELPDIIAELVEAGYRALAKKKHPDVGGKTTDMVELNLVTEQLRMMFTKRRRAVRG